MKSKKPKGVMGIDYHTGRGKKKSLKYRLGRRTKEVVGAIEKYAKEKRAILDLGTADGLMLSRIKNTYPLAECVGIEYCQELIQANKDKRIKIFQGDVLHPPKKIKRKKIDIVIATAIIEHVDSPSLFAKIVYDFLKPNGIGVVTTPVPFFDKLATAVGHLPKEDHQQTLTLTGLEKIFRKQGFKILEKKRFMFSPVGFPKEEFIEKIMRKIKIDFLMANQMLVVRKKIKSYV